MKKKNVWIIAFSDLHRDPRVFRQIQWLSPHYHVTTFGFTSSGIESVRHIPLHRPKSYLRWYHLGKWTKKLHTVSSLLLRQFEHFYWSNLFHQQVLASIENLQEIPDLVLTNDIETMPIALKASKGCPLILDLHEYSPREWEDLIKWRILFQPYVKYLTTHYLPKATTSFTVCQGIAEEYEKNFGVKPAIITNAPTFCDLRPSPLCDGQIRMIHHGGAAPSRRIEEMIYLMDHLDKRFQLDFMLVPGDLSYIKKMEKLASHHPRIKFLPPVPMQELPHLTNNYDIGLYYLPPVSFNSLHALPNKFFEFVQARLAVAIGPSPEMARYVQNYQCGIVGDQFDIKNLAQKLSELTPEKLSFYKQNTHRAALDLNAEKNKQTMLETITSLL
jgi:hypothetical protein